MLRAQSGAPAPADTAANQPDPPPPPREPSGDRLAGFKLTGFAAGSYSYSGHSAGGTAIVGRLYDRLHNRFMLNALGRRARQAIRPREFTRDSTPKCWWDRTDGTSPTGNVQTSDRKGTSPTSTSP